MMHALPPLFRGTLSLLVTLAALLMVSFALSSASPIDPVVQILGDHATLSSYRELHHQLGLDDPWLVRFARYVGGLAHADLGRSQSTGNAVSADLSRVFPATVELATVAMAVSTVVGVLLGVASAWKPRGGLDSLVRIVSIVGNSVPIFWLGLLALYLFYAHLQWVGGPGRLDDAFEYTIEMPTGLVLVDSWRSHVPGAFLSALQHMILPAGVLASYAIGNISRLTRQALLGESGKEYVTLARAKGCSEWRIVTHHLLPNVAGIVLTVLALTYAELLEGAVLVETIFSWPGLGRYLTTALFSADTPAILGATLLIGACFVVINGAADTLARMLDPRLS